MCWTPKPPSRSTQRSSAGTSSPVRPPPPRCPPTSNTPPRTENEYESFTLYFLAFDHGAPTTPENRFAREGILELTHNHGTESDSAFAGYTSGNADPGRGFGHIAITVDDIEAACARFEQLGVRFQKRLTDGKMKHIAFILDPDG